MPVAMCTTVRDMRFLYAIHYLFRLFLHPQPIHQPLNPLPGLSENKLWAYFRKTAKISEESLDTKNKPRAYFRFSDIFRKQAHPKIGPRKKVQNRPIHVVLSMLY